MPAERMTPIQKAVLSMLGSDWTPLESLNNKWSHVWPDMPIIPLMELARSGVVESQIRHRYRGGQRVGSYACYRIKRTEDADAR